MGQYTLPSAPGKHVVVNGIRVHYLESGPKKAPVLLLVHGILDSTNAWSDVLPLLKGNFRILLVDLPGFGYSERRESFSMSLPDQAGMLAGFLGALKISSCNLVGHSMGGGISIVMASRHPERVEKLVLVSPVSYPFNAPLKGRLGMMRGIGPLVVGYVFNRWVLNDFVHNDVFYDKSKVKQEDIDLLYAHFDTPEGRAASQRAMVAVDNPEWLKVDIQNIQIPVQIVWGEKDTLVPFALSYRLESDLPDARLHVVKQCGHMVQKEKPEEFAEVVLDFLRT